MSAPTTAAGAPAPRASAARAFVALCERDLWVTVRHEPLAFLSQALLQPIFFLFVFGRVLPEIGARTELALVYPERRLIEPQVRAFVDHAFGWFAARPVGCRKCAGTDEPRGHTAQ